jgi:PAS domain S-box-containing protein
MGCMVQDLLPALSKSSAVKILIQSSGSLPLSANYSDLTAYFLTHATAIGVLIVANGDPIDPANLRGVVSRRRFLEWIPRLSSEPPESAAPLSTVTDFWQQIQRFEVANGEVPILESLSYVSSRPGSEIYEPLVIQTPEQLGLLDVHNLLIAHAFLSQNSPPALPLHNGKRPLKTLVMKPRQRKKLHLPTLTTIPAPILPILSPPPIPTSELLGNILEYVEDGIEIIDQYGRTEYINPALEKMMGYSLEELRGQESFLLFCNEDNNGTFYRNIFKIVQAGEVWRGELTGRRRDGSLASHLATFSGVFDEEDRFRYCVAIRRSVERRDPVEYRDPVEEHSQMRERTIELEAQMAELQKLNRMKDDFLSTVSHELRTPMANMKLAIWMLRSSKSYEKRESYLRILEAECARETDLITDLLDMQRLEAGMGMMLSESIVLSDWLPCIMESFSVRTQERQQSLTLEVFPDLPPLISDSRSLERILVELLNNACKYTPPGRDIVVRAGRGPRSSAVWPTIELSVCNGGVEIPMKELPRIFEKFYRIPHHDPWKQGGTGLGLALVKKMVEQLGGTISVLSHSGATTFAVELPQAPNRES